MRATTPSVCCSTARTRIRRPLASRGARSVDGAPAVHTGIETIGVAGALGLGKPERHVVAEGARAADDAGHGGQVILRVDVEDVYTLLLADPRRPLLVVALGR